MRLIVESAEGHRPASEDDTYDRPCGDQYGSSPAYVFVGERRSRRAIQMGVRWEDGRLAARTLHAALRAAGLDPGRQRYRNVYRDEGPRVIDSTVLDELRRLVATGTVVVGMGRAAQATLARVGIPHLRLIHPAARGAIRARGAYHVHVAAVLRQAPMPFRPDTASGDHVIPPELEAPGCRC